MQNIYNELRKKAMNTIYYHVYDESEIHSQDGIIMIYHNTWYKKENSIIIYGKPYKNENIQKEIRSTKLNIFSLKKHGQKDVNFCLIAEGDKIRNHYAEMMLDPFLMSQMLFVYNDANTMTMKISRIARAIRVELGIYGNKKIHRLICNSIVDHLIIQKKELRDYKRKAAIKEIQKMVIKK